MSTTLGQLQARVRELYGEKDARRGVEGTFMWFMEEVGELSAALRGGTHDERVLEFADVLAWLVTLANTVGVDLEEAVARKYGGGCPGVRGRAVRVFDRVQTVIPSAGGDMRKLAFGLILIAVAAGPAVAQDPPVKILAAKVGLPPGRFTSETDDTGAAAFVNKTNTWAPVYVQLEMVKEYKRRASLVVETKDTDGLSYSVTIPLPDLSQLPPGTRIEPAEMPAFAYLRPAGQDITATVKQTDAGDPAYWRAISSPYKLKFQRSREANKYVVLSLGTKLPGFDLPGGDANNQGGPQEGRGLRGGRVETAAILDVALMPDQWFGYNAADLVVLTTGAADQPFLNALFADPNRKNKLDALLEWVRRGGRLLVSVGSNAGLVGQYETFRDIIPANIVGIPAQVPQLSLDWHTGRQLKRVPLLQPKQGTFAVANLTPKPDRPYRPLLPNAADGQGERRTVVVQSAFGLGKVTLAAIDLDRSPFIDRDFPGRAAFWDLLLSQAGAEKAATAQKQTNNFGVSSASLDAEDELSVGLRNTIDSFEGVPVISFGWVAAFIVLYTLLIGPVEYFVLKKVFKRLELTWITFPIIVLTVSAIAYFTAYALKGADLKINKVDLVDVDAAGGRVYGRTWFTIFSPRIENYTIGVTPADGWATGAGDQPPPLVDWYGGSAKSRDSSFFSRRYRYHADPDTGVVADGLIDVPIQVWSTKAFTAEWSARTDKAAPLVASNLTHPPADRASVTGSFTFNLPLPPLKDVRLIYAGKAYKYDGPVGPGATVNVFLDQAKEDTDWFASLSAATAFTAPVAQTDFRGRSQTNTTFVSGSDSLFHALFHEKGQGGTDVAQRNASLRRLDQSWRLSADNRDEVILVGKVATAAGDAEAIMSETNGASPAKLWLKGLPGTGIARAPVPGHIKQDTFVRVYVPVKPSR